MTVSCIDKRMVVNIEGRLRRIMNEIETEAFPKKMFVMIGIKTNIFATTICVDFQTHNSGIILE